MLGYLNAAVSCNGQSCACTDSRVSNESPHTPDINAQRKSFGVQIMLWTARSSSIENGITLVILHVMRRTADYQLMIWSGQQHQRTNLEFDLLFPI